MPMPHVLVRMFWGNHLVLLVISVPRANGEVITGTPVWAEHWNPPPGCWRLSSSETITAIQSAIVADSSEELFKGATKLAFKNACGEHQNASQVPLDAAEIANNFPRLSQLKDSMEVNGKGAGKGARKRKALKQGAEHASGMLRNMELNDEFDFGIGEELDDNKENRTGGDSVVGGETDEEEDDVQEEAVTNKRRRKIQLSEAAAAPDWKPMAKKDSAKTVAKTQLAKIIADLTTTLRKDVTALASSELNAAVKQLKQFTKKLSTTKPGVMIDKADLDLIESGSEMLTHLEKSLKPIIMFHGAKNHKKGTNTTAIIAHAVFVKNCGYVLPCSIYLKLFDTEVTFTVNALMKSLTQTEAEAQANTEATATYFDLDQEEPGSAANERARPPPVEIVNIMQLLARITFRKSNWRRSTLG